MKKNIILTLFFLLLSCVSSSKKEEVLPNPCCGFYSVSIGLQFLNSNSQDLLDSIVSGYYPFKNMRLYYLVNGLKKEVYEPTAYTPRNMTFEKSSSGYVLGIFTSTSQHAITSDLNGVQKGLDTTLLSLNEIETDTIITQWLAESSSFINQKVWYKAYLHAPSTVTGNLITVVK